VIQQTRLESVTTTSGYFGNRQNMTIKHIGLGDLKCRYANVWCKLIIVLELRSQAFGAFNGV